MSEENNEGINHINPADSSAADNPSQRPMNVPTGPGGRRNKRGKQHHDDSSSPKPMLSFDTNTELPFAPATPAPNPPSADNTRPTPAPDSGRPTPAPDAGRTPRTPPPSPRNTWERETPAPAQPPRQDAFESAGAGGSIWEKLYGVAKSESVPPYIRREHHKFYGPNDGFSTCCPNCADIHLRGDCLYDVTDVLLYYMDSSGTDNDAFQAIIESFRTHKIGGVNYMAGELLKTPVSGAENRFRLRITCGDVVKKICRNVMYMNAVSDNPIVINSGDMMRRAFEIACGWRVLKYYPSMNVQTGNQATGGKSEPDKQIELPEIESFLETLFRFTDTVVCDVAIDSFFHIYDTRRAGGRKDDMLLLRCRKCGMPIALNAGLYDEVIVGMLGLPSAGKSSLIYAINYWISQQIAPSEFLATGGVKSRYSIVFEYNQYDIGSGPRREDCEKFKRMESIDKTDRGVQFHSTITVKLLDNNRPVKCVNLVLIDIAGETTLGDDVHPIYYCSDCFWFCLLPSQNGVNDGTVDQLAEEITRRKEFYQRIIGQNVNGRRNSQVPIAIVYTRSDCYTDETREFVEYAHAVDGFDRTDDISRYLVTDNNLFGINAANMRNTAYRILRFIADYPSDREKRNLSQFANITRGNNEALPDGRAPRRSDDKLDFFESICRYIVFACSPYGSSPIDAAKKELQKKYEHSMDELRIRRDKKEKFAEDLRKAKEKVKDLEEKIRKAEDEGADWMKVEELDDDLSNAQGDVEAIEAVLRKADEEYEAAREAKREISRAKAREERIIEMNDAEVHPDPFGVMLPMIWSLGLNNGMLTPLVFFDGVKPVDDNWLAVNTTVAPPKINEPAPRSSGTGFLGQLFGGGSGHKS
jgi:Chromosome segregation ATPases